MKYLIETRKREIMTNMGLINRCRTRRKTRNAKIGAIDAKIDWNKNWTKRQQACFKQQNEQRKPNQQGQSAKLKASLWLKNKQRLQRCRSCWQQRSPQQQQMWQQRAARLWMSSQCRRNNSLAAIESTMWRNSLKTKGFLYSIFLGIFFFTFFKFRYRFNNATIGNLDYADFETAKKEALEFDDFAGQNTLEKYELLKFMMLYLQPAEFQDWNRFSGYGCWCFQSFDTEFWRGQGLPKDEIDKWVTMTNRYQFC